MTEIQPCPHGHTPGTCRACLHAENERLQADLQKALANHTADLSVPEPSSTEVESLRRENVRWENAHKIVLAENERLKRQVDELSTHAEKWVKRALARTEDGSGPSDLVQQMRLAGYHDWASAVERLQRPVTASIRELTASAYKDGYGADLTDDRDLSARTLELMRQLSRPVHEREGPHCPTCECSLVDVGRATQDARLKRIEQLMDANTGTPEGAELDRLVDEQERSEADWLAKPPGDG